MLLQGHSRHSSSTSSLTRLGALNTLGGFDRSHSNLEQCLLGAKRLALLVACLLLVISSPCPLHADNILPVSVAGELSLSADGSLNWDSFQFPGQRQISDDGRYLVFTSRAANLAADDVNGQFDVFLHDRDSGDLFLVSHSNTSPTTAGNGISMEPAVSADGNSVVFISFATDLVSGIVDTNGGSDVFIWDRGTGLVTLVSHSTTGSTTTGNSASRDPVISADGNGVVFASGASDLVGGTDANGSDDVFIWNQGTGAVALVSHSTSGATTTGNGWSYDPVISADGGTVVFLSYASDLVSGTDPGFNSDVFIWDQANGAVTLVSHSTASPVTAGNSESNTSLISGDGDTVMFLSRASDLVSGFVDANSEIDLFLWDRGTGLVTLVNHSISGATTTGNNGAEYPMLSEDGSTVLFHSTATDLVTGFVDANGGRDVFIWHRGTGVVDLVSHSTSSTTTSGNGVSDFAAINGDGSKVVFRSSATDLACTSHQFRSETVETSCTAGFFVIRPT